MTRIKWYEVAPGNTSSLRVGYMIATICGALGFLFCIVFSILLFAFQRWEGIPIVTTIITASCGILAVGNVIKNMQKKLEIKAEEIRKE